MHIFKVNASFVKLIVFSYFSLFWINLYIKGTVCSFSFWNKNSEPLLELSLWYISHFNWLICIITLSVLISSGVSFDDFILHNSKRDFKIYISFLSFIEYFVNCISMFCPNKSFIFSLYRYIFNVGKHF